ncbi:MAG: aminotransferase class IV [Fibrobacterota bacterium]|nr:aminotransferase class IV [Fibrobacterota bacterium]QQS06908.1 MAG: aminotransferase class IV [Fibrobacterota bacterium]
MSGRWAFVDGHWSPEEEATIPVMDRGLLLGDGIFETVRVKEGVPEFFTDHYARFCTSAQAVRMRQPWSQAQLEALCAEICARSSFSDASVRITLTRGAYKGTLSDTGDAPRLIVTCASVEHTDPAIYSKGVAIAIASFPKVHALPAHVKATQYLPAVLARLEADEQGCYETLFLDPRDRVLELASATFFGVRDGRIITPPLRLGLLPGITRKVVMGLAKDLRIPVREGILKRTDLNSLSEAFLTSAVRGIVPIVTLGGARVGQGAIGPITRKLMEQFRSATGR